MSSPIQLPISTTQGDNNSYKVEYVLNPNGCLLILMLASACDVVILYSTIMELFASCDVLVSSLQLKVKIVKSSDTRRY
jgi:hypothetical protein